MFCCQIIIDNYYSYITQVTRILRSVKCNKSKQIIQITVYIHEVHTDDICVRNLNMKLTEEKNIKFKYFFFKVHAHNATRYSSK